MNILEAMLLGCIQGLTEFLPVSSSTHLHIAKWFLGVEHPERYLFFDLICHLGTAFAAILFFYKEIVEIINSPKMILQFFIALLPLIPCYFLLKPLREGGHHPLWLSLMFTGIILFISTWMKEKPFKGKYRDMLFIGFMQGMALIPGISRSGSTISGALFRGWEVQKAIRFSFLLAIPAILGGGIVEVFAKNKLAIALPIHIYITGFLLSFLTGFLGIKMLSLFLDKKRLRPLAFYCMGVGLFVLALKIHG